MALLDCNHNVSSLGYFGEFYYFTTYFVPPTGQPTF